MLETKKLYEKKSKKSTSQKKKSARKGTTAREQRRKNALQAFSIKELLQHFKMPATTCPSCKEQKALQVKQSEFKCSKCKQKGHAVKLVKLICDISDWKAIYYIEDLAIKKQAVTKSKPEPKSTVKPKPKSTPKPQTKPPQVQKPKSKAISERDLENLKQNVSIVDLVQTSGIKLKKSSNGFVGLCPFHEDKNASLSITPQKNLWNCFACQKGGSVVDWVMCSEKVDFVTAIEKIKSKHTAITLCSSPQSKPRTKPTTAIATDTANDQELLQQVIHYYHQKLKSSRLAIEYLEKRGIAKAIDAFQIGFADRTLGIKMAGRKDKKREELQRVGILRKSGHEHFTGSIIIPIIDDDQIGEVYGRKINDNLRKETPKHLFLPGAHKGVFNRHALGEEVIITEALIDALSFWVNGFKNVTSSYGTGGFTEDIHRALLQAQTKRLYIAYDNDESGNNAAQKLAMRLANDGIECRRVVFPQGVDANSFMCEKQKPQEHIHYLLAQAKPLNKPAKIATPVPSKTTPSLTVNPKPKQQTAKQEKIEQYRNIAIEHHGEDIMIRLHDRKYRIRGLQRNLAYDVLRINIRVALGTDYHIDTLDLYQARHRHNFIRAVATELSVHSDIIKSDVGQIVLKLEELQHKNIDEALNPKKVEVAIPKHEREEALRFLRSPNLIEKINEDFAECGLVGEKMNAMIGYLAATSRKLNDPLALVIQSSSSGGKSSLMDMILAMMPEEEKVKYTAMTGQSLFYMGETNLKHKILAICEEEGAERASYSLKVLQSDRYLSIASTGKNPKTGRLITNEYKVEGPTQIMLSTTSEEIDEEFQNRCLIATVDEGREQTRAIHDKQRERETLSGIFNRKRREDILRKQQNAQRLLKPVIVVNPYAKKLTFLDSRLRMRRDHVKYLTLIRSIALLHQYQRPVKQVKHQGKQISYIEVKREDIILANKLTHHILGTSLDEMAPQTRTLLNTLHRYVSNQCKQKQMQQMEFRFSRKDIRLHTGWSNTQLKVHLDRLVDMEYLYAHRGRRGVSYAYELVYKGEESQNSSFVMGLLDPAKL